MRTQSTYAEPTSKVISGFATRLWWLCAIVLIALFSWKSLAQLTVDISYLAAKQLHAKGYSNGALSALSTVHYIAADQPYLYNEAGAILYERNQPEASREYLQAGLQSGLTHAGLLNNLAVLSFEDGEIERAAELQKLAVKTNANHATLHYNLGFLMTQSNDALAASRSFREATRVNPEWNMPHLWLAYSYLQQEKYGLAEEYALKTIRFNKNQADAHEIYVRSLLGQHRLIDAEKAITAMETHTQNLEKANYYRAMALYLQGDLTQAKVALEKLFMWTHDNSLRKRIAIELRILN